MTTNRRPKPTAPPELDDLLLSSHVVQAHVQSSVLSQLDISFMLAALKGPTAVWDELVSELGDPLAEAAA